MKPQTLKIMEALNARMALNGDEKRYLQNLRKGYAGERRFVEHFAQLKSPHILLADLNFNTKYSGQIQLDLLLLIKNSLVIYEVKNYSGEWHFGNESFSNENQEIPNPTIQALRSKNNFKRLLKGLGYEGVHVEVVVVFVNPDFTLYGAPLDKNVLLPSQINTHLNSLSKLPRPYDFTFSNLAEELRENESPGEAFHKHIPHYTYSALSKGVFCSDCGVMVKRISQRSYQCPNCRLIGRNQEGVCKSINEFKLLFPNEQLTAVKLNQWCGDFLSYPQCALILRSE